MIDTDIMIANILFEMIFTYGGYKMVEKKRSFYFLNLDLPERRTGIENASLLRNRVFEKELGITPTIITTKYNPRLNLQRQELLDYSLISENVDILNLYEYYQKTDLENVPFVTKELKTNTAWTYQNIRGTFNYRVYNTKGQKMIYHACDAMGRLKYNNVFHQGKKVRREYFDSNGFLSKVQMVDSDSGSVSFETYYTVEGKVCIFKHINPKNRTAELIQLVDAQGQVYASFDNENSFIDYWLQSVLKHDEDNYLLIDKQRVYYPILKEWHASNVYRIPCIHSTHVKEGEHYLNGDINYNYKAVFEDVTVPEAVVVLTDKQKQHIEERFHDNQTFYSIPHAIETLPSPVDFQQREMYSAVYLARFSDSKQHDSAVRVFQFVVAKIPEAKLYFYGGGRNRNEIRHLIRELHLENNIFLCDYETDVEKIYHKSQISISTSSIEGFSLFILESIAHGCPVISYDINYGPNELIENGFNGELIELNAEEAMARSIVQLFNNQNQLQQMSENAYRKAKQFSSENVAEKWSVLINEATK